MGDALVRLTVRLSREETRMHAGTTHRGRFVRETGPKEAKKQTEVERGRSKQPVKLKGAKPGKVPEDRVRVLRGYLRSLRSEGYSDAAIAQAIQRAR